MKIRRSDQDGVSPTNWAQLAGVAVTALLCGIVGASLFQPGAQGHIVFGSGKQQAALPTCKQLLQRKLAIKKALLEDRNQTPQPEEERLLFDRFEPAWTCLFDRRLGGNFGDGGKFVCGDDGYFRREACLAYSVGSNGDASFEQAIGKHFGCEMHTFDPTGDSAAYAKVVAAAGSKFHTWGLDGVVGKIPNPDAGPNVSNPLLPLGRIVSRLGHGGRHIDILKVDCEGCEYVAFPAIWSDLQAGKYTIGQIQIELHLWGLEDWAQLQDFFNGAEAAGFVIFHKERNHWGCEGWQCVEYALVHLDTAIKMLEFEVPGCTGLSNR